MFANMSQAGIVIDSRPAFLRMTVVLIHSLCPYNRNAELQFSKKLNCGQATKKSGSTIIRLGFQ